MLVAPLNWGLGHSTRCIPIINALIKANFEPIVASDGNALLLLQKEFPFLKSYELPSYNVKYSKSGKNLKFKLLLSIPSIISAVKREKKAVTKIVKEEGIIGIISDNRFGVYNAKIPSVYLTHQLNVLSGNTSFITSKVHQKFIKKFTECWVPDVLGKSNLSGDLGHIKNTSFKVKYIGNLSRFQPKQMETKYNIMVLLSGPEPQRTLLEEKLFNELKNYKGKVLFVRGVLNEIDKISAPENFRIVNYMLSNELEKALNESDSIISRSGYSTIMDLAALGKKAFFIPTPGQFEQEYLAKYLSEKNVTPFINQGDFRKDCLNDLGKYSGLNLINTNLNLSLFKLFKSE